MNELACKCRGFFSNMNGFFFENTFAECECECRCVFCMYVLLYKFNGFAWK